MKTLYKLFAIGLAGVAFASCNELDTEPQGNVVTEDQKKEVVAIDPSMISASVQGITQSMYLYNDVFPTLRHNDFGYASLMIMMDTRGYDMVSVNTGYNWYRPEVTYQDVLSTSDMCELGWSVLYKQIYSCNSVIALIDPESDDATLRRYRAQALAFRAFDYSVLAQLYAKTYVGNEDSPCVPLITDENSNSAAQDGCPRSTVREVYAQILSDLNTAIDILKDSPVNSSRDAKRYFDVASATGLRARVNLVMNKWADAAADAQFAIEKTNSQPYSMTDVNHPNFNTADAPSFMWAIIMAEQDDLVQSGLLNFPSMMGSFNYGYAAFDTQLWRYGSKSLFNSIPASDVRKGWFVDENLTSPASENYDGIITGLVGYEIDAETTLESVADYLVRGIGQPYVQLKFAPYQNVFQQTTNASDVPLMRVEEMYLIRAEATAMAGNPSQGASYLQEFVKAYRDPQYVCAAGDAASVQEAVYQQRRIELWGEGMSYFDILRLKKPMDRRGAGFEASACYNIPAGDPALILQIPQSEVEANSALGANNEPGVQPTPVQDI